MRSHLGFVLIFLIAVSFAFANEAKAASLNADACEPERNADVVPAWCNGLPTILGTENDSDAAECGTFFETMTECVHGDVLEQDTDGDGVFDVSWYIVSGTVDGDDGRCPQKTSYSGAEIQDYISTEPAFYNWLIDLGFSDYDDFCAIN